MDKDGNYTFLERTGIALSDYSDTVVVSVSTLLYIFAFLSMIGIFGWQIYTWLRTGTWQSLEFKLFFTYIDANKLLTLIYNPTDWKGIAKFAKWIIESPLAIALPIFIFFIGQIISSFKSEE